MTSFEQKEQKGRDSFITTCQQQKWCKINKFATDKYSKWDVSYYSGNTQLIGEIKYRKEDSSAFKDWIMEVDKFKALKDIQAKLNVNNKKANITYINIFSDNITYIWNLDNIDLNEIEIKQLWLPKNNEDETLILKDVFFLLPIDAIFRDESDLTKSIFISKYEDNNDEFDF